MNALKGPMPESLTNIVNLEYLNLSANQFCPRTCLTVLDKVVGAHRSSAW